MDIFCKSCGKIIPHENINVKSDLAQCPHCNMVSALSTLIDSKTNQQASASPPIGSRIILNKSNFGNTEIILPKAGFKARYIPIIIFTTIWIGFISFWTFMAVKIHFLPALFSIPFWLVGFYMLFKIVNSMKETQTISLNKSGFTLQKNRIIFSKNYEVSFNEIHDIRLERISARDFRNSDFSFNSSDYKNIPAILKGDKTIRFFETANEAESDWIVNYLNLARKKQ